MRQWKKTISIVGSVCLTIALACGVVAFLCQWLIVKPESRIIIGEPWESNHPLVIGDGVKADRDDPWSKEKDIPAK